MSKFTKSLAISSVLSIFAVTSMAQAEEERDPRIGEEVDRICFQRNIDGFTNAKRNSVVLHASGKKRYYVEVSSCFQMRNAGSIGIDSPTSCITPGDILVVSDSHFGFGGSSSRRPDRCFIKNIYQWHKTPPVEAEETEGDEV